MNVAIKTAGTWANLPGGSVTVDSEPAVVAGKNPVEVLIAETLPPFENLNVEHLIVFRNNFALDSNFELDSNCVVMDKAARNGIDPATRRSTSASARSGCPSPPASSSGFWPEKVFAFVGRVDGLEYRRHIRTRLGSVEMDICHRRARRQLGPAAPAATSQGVRGHCRGKRYR